MVSLKWGHLYIYKISKIKNFFACTGVHESEEKNILMYSSKGVADRSKFFFGFGEIFEQMKKILNFWNFVNIKVAPFKLNHLGNWVSFDRAISKVIN